MLVFGGIVVYQDEGVRATNLGGDRLNVCKCSQDGPRYSDSAQIRGVSVPKVTGDLLLVVLYLQESFRVVGITSLLDSGNVGRLFSDLAFAAGKLRDDEYQFVVISEKRARTRLFGSACEKIFSYSARLGPSQKNLSICAQKYHNAGGSGRSSFAAYRCAFVSRLSSLGCHGSVACAGCGACCSSKEMLQWQESMYRGPEMVN